MLEVNQNIKTTIRNLLIFNIVMVLIRSIPYVDIYLHNKGRIGLALSYDSILYIRVVTLYAMFLLVAILVGIQVVYKIKSSLLIGLCVLQTVFMFQIYQKPFNLIEKALRLSITTYGELTMLCSLIIISIVFFIHSYKSNAFSL